MDTTYYSKSKERKLKIYGQIIDGLTLGFCKTWVKKKYFDYKKTTILNNILYHTGTGSAFNPYILAPITVLTIQSGDVLERSVRLRDTWDPNLNIEINIVDKKMVVVFKGNDVILTFDRYESTQTILTYSLLWNYYERLKSEVVIPPKQNKPITFTYINK